jgi:hypothetical protein
MLRYDAMREREPDTVPRGFGRKEGNEDALDVRRRYALAAVGDLYQRPLFPGAIYFSRTCYRHAADWGTFGNRFRRVANQVEQRLAQHALIGADQYFC